MLIIISAITFLASLLVCITSIYDQKTQKSAFFNLLTIAVTCYLTGNFFEITSETAAAALVGFKLSYLGIPFIPPLWYLCVREYCGAPIKNKYHVLYIMIIPIIIVMLAYTWESNKLLFTGFKDQSTDATTQLIFEEGRFYQIKQAYLYFFNILGILTIIYYYIKGTKIFRKQAYLFLISALIPAFNTTTIFIKTQGDYVVDITPFFLSLSMLVFYIALRKFGIHNLSFVIKENVFDNLSEGVVIFDCNGVFMNSNRAAKELFPKFATVPLGTVVDEIDYLPINLIDLKSSVSVVDEFTREKRGTIKTYRFSFSEIQKNNKIVGYSVIIYNISSFKIMMSELETKANTDTLTGIYNRGFFFEKSSYELEEAQHDGTNLSAIMFDLDFFKKINDTYGHACGDYVLRTIALIGKNNLRKNDIFGRYGGEEFSILLPKTSCESAISKAEMLRKKINTYIFEFEGIQLEISASFGVSTLNQGAKNETLDSLLKRADDNLYKAKANGRNRVI